MINILFNPEMIARRYGIFSLAFGVMAFLFLVIKPKEYQPLYALCILCLWCGILGIYLSRERNYGDKTAKLLSIVGVLLAVADFLLGMFKVFQG